LALTISELNAVSKKYFDKPITSQVYDQCALMKILMSMKKVREMGTQLQWPIRYQKYSRAGSVNPRQQIAFQTKTTRTAAVEDYGYYEVDTLVHWDDTVKNYGEGKIVDLMKDKAEEMQEDMSDALSTAIYAASPSTYDLSSLPEFIDSATTYAGVAVADAAEWAATEISSTETTELMIQNQYSLSYAESTVRFKNHGVTHHFTTPDLWNKYEALIQPNQRYQDKATANLGFANLTFRAKPVIHDQFCTASHWFGIDMDAIELWVHPEFNMKLTPWFDMTQQGYPGAKGRVMLFVGQFKVKRRKTMFKFSGLDYTK
jgi:hypothetical protein